MTADSESRSRLATRLVELMPADVLRSRFGWYAARLSAMPPAEVAWRARSSLPSTRRAENLELDWQPRGWLDLLHRLISSNADRLVADAARVAGGELDLWGRAVTVDPKAIDWFAHPLRPVAAPERMTRRAGFDLKPIWELHRQQHLFPLAAGAALGGVEGWASLCLTQVDDWVQRNPAPRFPGWTSGFETAHRLISWAWSLPLVVEHGDHEIVARISSAYERQARFVEQHPSRFTSANNHRLGELVGLLAANAIRATGASWEAVWAELEWHAERQTFSDGGSREQASGYFLYGLELLWVAGLFAHGMERGLGRIRDVLSRRLQWLDALAGVDGEPPPIGDDSEDRAIRCEYFLGRSASALANRIEALLGGDPTLAAGPARAPSARSTVLPQSGYAVFRGQDAGRSIRIVIDTGNLGFGRLAAHGHADALSVTLDAAGTPILRDSGTGSYVAAEGRDDFRTTSAHNSIVVDGESQAEPLGPHLWGRRFVCELEEAHLGATLDYVRAGHDGYERRAAGARHTRSVVYLKPDLLFVLDRVAADRECTADLCWNLGPGSGPHGVLEGARLRVAAFPSASSRVELGPYSVRYSSQLQAPRAIWTARGRTILFATVVGLSGIVAPVALEVDGSSMTAVTTFERRRVEVLETWSGRPTVSISAV